MLQALVEAHPDRASRLDIHVKALEAAIESEPHRCLERVRALFEATFYSVAPHLGLRAVVGKNFQAQSRRIIKALDFTLSGHPEAERIAEVIRKLLGNINGTIGTLAELSNIRGLRHGGSLDWSTLQQHHAVMLGGLCDTLVAFIFDVAWSRGAEVSERSAIVYGDHPDWNENLDDRWGSIRIEEGEYWASRVLFALDPTQYDLLRVGWRDARATGEGDAA